LGNLVTILITAGIVVFELVLAIFMVYLEFIGIPYRQAPLAEICAGPVG
jgi:hypothetical protein